MLCVACGSRLALQQGATIFLFSVFLMTIYDWFIKATANTLFPFYHRIIQEIYFIVSILNDMSISTAFFI